MSTEVEREVSEGIIFLHIEPILVHTIHDTLGVVIVTTDFIAIMFGQMNNISATLGSDIIAHSAIKIIALATVCILLLFFCLFLLCFFSRQYCCCFFILGTELIISYGFLVVVVVFLRSPVVLLLCCHPKHC